MGLQITGSRLLALPARRHIPVNAPLFQVGQVPLVAVPRIGQHRLRLRGERLLYRVEQHRQLTLVARVRRQVRRHHQLVLRVHRHLRVVALLESLVARLHDRAFRVREVALRFLVRLAIRPLVRPTALRVPILPRLPTPRVVRRPSRRFQTRLRFPDRRQTRFSPTQLRRQIVAPNLRAQARVLGLVNRIRLTQQRLDLAFQALFLCLHPVVAHRLALARVRAHLRPVDRQLPQARQTQLLRQTDHLHEQRLEILQVPTPKLAQRPVLRKVARRQHPETNVLFQLPSDPARREYPRRVGVEQHLHHHPRLIRRVATAVPLLQSVERRQIQTVHQIADMVRQVALGQPLPHVGRQQQRLVRHVGAECGRHRVLPSSARLQLSHLFFCGADS